MRRAVHGHHPRRAQDRLQDLQGRRAYAQGDPRRPRRLCDRSEPRQEGVERRRPQPLQAPEPRDEEQRRRTGQVEHPADRPDRFGQDAAGPDAGAHPRRAVHHGRRHHADRSRLRGRGRREHHPEAAAGVRLQRGARAARHHLHRRDRQDRAQGREPLDHARCVGRRRAAGPAEDHGRHGRFGAAAGRPQAPAAGIPAGRHDEHPVHLRRRVRRAGKDHLGPGPRHFDRLRRQGVGPGRPPHRRDLPPGGAGRPAALRPDPRIHRPSAGDRDPGRPRRGRPGQDPDRAEERLREAVSASVRHGECRPDLHRRRA
uniref:ATP-dependent Clp protease proteolytic subunit n=1 Tax=Parastrongyloides trichosuri TaxID=131310 RepID=A0A0N4Z3F8_PARTI